MNIINQDLNIEDWIPTRSCVAWINPDGKVNLVDFYNHVNFFKNHPRMGDAYKRYEEGLEENQRIIDDDLASLDTNEHPAMHRFEYLNEDTRDELYKEAYEAGFLRLGVHMRKYAQKTTYIIEVYGAAQFLDKLEYTFKKLGRDLSAKVTFFYVVKKKSCGVFDYEKKTMTITKRLNKA